MAAAVSEPLARAILKRGREGPVRGGNPWIFSQAIERIEPPSLEAGALVAVHDAAGALIGMGYCNPATTIAIRMLAWGETPAIDELVARRLKSALGLRKRFHPRRHRCVPARQRRRRWAVGRGRRSIRRRAGRANSDRGRRSDARYDCRGAERTASSALDHRTKPWRGEKAGGPRRSHCGSRRRTSDRNDRDRERN